MQKAIDRLKGRDIGDRSGSSEKTQLSQALSEVGVPEGFSLEWIFDRLEHVGERR